MFQKLEKRKYRWHRCWVFRRHTNSTSYFVPIRLVDEKVIIHSRELLLYPLTLCHSVMHFVGRISSQWLHLAVSRLLLNWDLCLTEGHLSSPTPLINRSDALVMRSWIITSLKIWLASMLLLTRSKSFCLNTCTVLPESTIQQLKMKRKASDFFQIFLSLTNVPIIRSELKTMYASHRVSNHV